MCVSLQGDQCVLMSVITGDSQAMVRDMEDSEVVELCMNVLRELYKEQVNWSKCNTMLDMDKISTKMNLYWELYLSTVMWHCRRFQTRWSTLWLVGVKTPGLWCPTVSWRQAAVGRLMTSLLKTCRARSTSLARWEPFVWSKNLSSLNVCPIVTFSRRLCRSFIACCSVSIFLQARSEADGFGLASLSWHMNSSSSTSGRPYTWSAFWQRVVLPSKKNSNQPGKLLSFTRHVRKWRAEVSNSVFRFECWQFRMLYIYIIGMKCFFLFLLNQHHTSQTVSFFSLHDNKRVMLSLWPTF